MRYRNTWLDATVLATEKIANNVRLITIKPSNGVDSYTVGAHIDVSVLINDLPEIRSYSLIGTAKKGEYTIAVKRLQASRGGSKYMWTLEPGQHIKISQPTNHFELGLDASSYLLIAGGIGITPLVGMAEELKNKSAEISMIYVGQNENEMPFIKELKSILEDNLILHFSDSMGLFKVEEILNYTTEKTGIYLCGPLGLINAVRKVWENSGFIKANLRFETFGASGLFAPQEFKVKLPRFNKEIVVAENQTILSALEDEGLEVMYDCKKGECGICQVKVLEYTGDIDHRDFFLSEVQKKKNNKMCICVSRVANGSLVLETSYRPK